MAKSAPKLILSPSRDIPLDRLELSQSNVRRIKAGVSIEALADDIARRGLLHGLNVRPILDETGEETGRYEIPAGGRRYRALGLLVKRKLLASDAPIPCVVRAANDDILAEDDSYAENAMREALHPLDQFRAMQAMVDKGDDVEAIAAHHFVTPAVVRQRLKLAGVAPKLHDAYADDEISLEQLMAFTISDDFERQIQVFELLTESRSLAPHLIRQKLTENVVRAADKRARFVTADAYVEAGGGIVRDLFEADGGGWLTDPALLDRLVDEKLKAEGEALLGEGWKWVATSVDLAWDALRDHREIDRDEVPKTTEEEARIAELEAEGEEIDREWSEAEEVPDDIHARVDAINAEYAAIEKRPLTFAPEDIAIAGVFVSLERDGSLRIDRGYVRPEDEPVDDEEEMDDDASEPGVAPVAGGDAGMPAQSSEDADDAEGAEELKPLPDRLVSDLTAWRTLALQDAFAQDPATAYLALLHDRVSVTFTLGGQISAADYEALASVIVTEGLSTEWDGPAFETSHRTEGEPLELFANEVAWGRVEALETFCADHGLPYRFWAGGFFAEWSAERIVFRGEGAADSFIVDESDRVLIDRGEIERRGSIEAVLAYFDSAEFTVPPLLVEGDLEPGRGYGTAAAAATAGEGDHG